MPTDSSQSPYLHPTPYVPFIPRTGQNRKEARPHTLSQAVRPKAQRREETHPEGGCQLAAEPRLTSGLEIPCPAHRPSLSPSPQARIILSTCQQQLPHLCPLGALTPGDSVPGNLNLSILGRLIMSSCDNPYKFVQNLSSAASFSHRPFTHLHEGKHPFPGQLPKHPQGSRLPTPLRHPPPRRCAVPSPNQDTKRLSVHLEVALIDRLSVIACDKLTPTLSPQSLLLSPVCLSTDRIQELIHEHCICPEKSPTPWLWPAQASLALVWSQAAPSPPSRPVQAARPHRVPVLPRPPQRRPAMLKLSDSHISDALREACGPLRREKPRGATVRET